MGELIIRKLEDADIEAISIIEEETFSMPWKPDDFREMIEKDHMLYVVAELDGTVIGGAGLVQVFQHGDVTNVCIAKDFRGHGYGKKLMNGLLDISREQGCLDYTLEVRVSNERAINLYKQIGFEDVGIRPGFYEKPREDAMIMTKEMSLEDFNTTWDSN